jgi:predicted PurR-regulated permease PerM
VAAKGVVMNQTSDAQRVATLAFYGTVVLIAVLAYRIVEPFLVEIGWAVVLAICLAPLQARVSRRFGATRSAAFLTLVVLLLMTVPLVLLARVVVDQGAHAVDYVQARLADRGGPMGLFHVVWQWLHQRLPFLPEEQEIVQRLSAGLGSLAKPAASQAGQLATGTLGVLFSIGITLGILFFILKDAPEMARAMGRLLPFGRERNARMLTLIRDIVSASVTSTLSSAVIQGVLGGLTFLLLGVPGALLWGGLMAVLALLPVAGATLVWAPAAIWLALSGSLLKGVILALVGVLVFGNVDNVVRPLMLSGTARMSTLMLIICLLGGVSAFGFIGIVLGPVVGAVLTAFVKAYVLEEDPLEVPALPPPPAAPPAAEPASSLGGAEATPPPPAP